MSTGDSSAKLWFGIKTNAQDFLKALCKHVKEHGWRAQERKAAAALASTGVGKKRGRTNDAADAEHKDKKARGDGPLAIWDQQKAAREEQFAKGEFLEWATAHCNESYIDGCVDSALRYLVGEANAEDRAVLEAFSFNQEHSKRALQIQFADLGGNVESDKEPGTDGERTESDEDNEEDEEKRMDERHDTREEPLDLSEVTVTKKHYQALSALSKMIGRQLGQDTKIQAFLETAVL